MIIFVGIIFGLVSGSYGSTCQSLSKQTCLTKSQVGPFSVFMQGGDPCFLFNGMRYCFINTSGSLHQCACTPECGCSGETVEPPPSCDNSAVPSTVGQCESCSTTNTMCLYCGIGDNCKNAVCQYGLTADEKDQVVDKHNELRRQVAKGLEGRGANGKSQPSASNMEKLVWSDELAEVAQRFADQCTFAHDKNRSTANFQYVGQNLAATGTSVNLASKQLDDMVTAWYDEVQWFDPADITPFPTKENQQSTPPPNKAVGHYTQLAWASTKYVGCGFIKFSDEPMYRNFLYCNYAVAGNFIGSTMYKEGAPGSECSGSVEDGLCL